MFFLLKYLGSQYSSYRKIIKNYHLKSCIFEQNTLVFSPLNNLHLQYVLTWRSGRLSMYCSTFSMLLVCVTDFFLLFWVSSRFRSVFVPDISLSDIDWLGLSGCCLALRYGAGPIQLRITGNSPRPLNRPNTTTKKKTCNIHKWLHCSYCDLNDNGFDGKRLWLEHEE